MNGKKKQSIRAKMNFHMEKATGLWETGCLLHVLFAYGAFRDAGTCFSFL